jgi:hypothetical protein
MSQEKVVLAINRKNLANIIDVIMTVNIHSYFNFLHIPPGKQFHSHIFRAHTPLKVDVHQLPVPSMFASTGMNVLAVYFKFRLDECVGCILQAAGANLRLSGRACGGRI